MSPPKDTRYRTPFLIAATIIFVWGIAGLLDLPNVPYGGFTTGPDQRVTRVFPGGPADEAGMMPGDRVTGIDDIAIEDARALNRRPRPQIGETRTVVVDREGLELNVNVTYASQPARDVGLGVASAIIGACFVVFGLLAYFKVPSRSGTLLALLGLAFGLTIGQPYIPSFALRTIAGFIQVLVIVLGFAFLLHFLMEFPRQKKILARWKKPTLLYAPAIVIALLFLFLFAFQPDATSGLNAVVNVLVGLFVAGYFGLALAAMVHSYVSSSPKERAAHGLNFMLVGAALGLIPLALAAFVGIFAPSVVLPGADFYFLTLVLIPISFALAVLKRSPGEPSTA